MVDSRTTQDLIGLRAQPVAIAFMQEPPVGLEKWHGAKPAGCAFWREAQDGASFYTVVEDHYNCAVGSYTHAIDLPPERSHELGDTLGLMGENGYLEMSEVPGIPRLDSPPAVVAYGPAHESRFALDVILISATPIQAMLIYEAALRAGAGEPATNLMGRPSCAILPFAFNNETAAVSLGCAGNRTYTGLGNDELYVTIPGGRWADFEARLAEIVESNQRMTRYYRDQENAITLLSPLEDPGAAGRAIG